MIARVSLDLGLRKEFDYSIPSELEGQVEVGSRVKVPFGHRAILGAVTALVEESPHSGLKPIIKVIGRGSILTPKVMRLARWMADYYCCPFEIALKTVLPESVRKEKEGWRERLTVRKLPPPEPFPKLTPRQRDIWKILEEWPVIPMAQLIQMTSATAVTIRKLEEKGLIGVASEISERDPYSQEQILPTTPLALNEEQRVALEKIFVALDAAGQAAEPESRVFLLHGVTGSGKTEVYLQAIQRTFEQGKGAIVLVPEISLTPQTVERFKARFSSGQKKTDVAVLHSHLSSGERHDEWQKIRQGRARIVIGARSAVFAPVDPLGLIIVDEEHEFSYKQEEAPRYHGRDVAVMRGRMEGAVVVLGTATPSLESYHNAKSGKYALLEMFDRADDKKMPLVRVVDMRSEGKMDKGPPILSRMLREAILQRIERREQTILFLNRRGFASSLQCPKCGYVAGCPNCSLALTYHRKIQKLRCHLCGHQEQAPNVCPEAHCKNPAIRYSGVGTERVEDSLGKIFPKANVRRMDSDALKRKDDYRKILGEFKTGKIDILVGTQMIAKGLHFPNVTLVGIIFADLSLHMPDFRASERTFQLLTQVAGRAGRGDVEGEVIVQAFTPFHFAIQHARRHDFEGFYEQEMEFRAELKYPPVSRAAMITFRGKNEEKVELSADYVRKQLDGEMAKIPDIIVAGPAPAPLLRMESNYRYQIMLRTRHMTKLSRLLSELTMKTRLPEGVALSVDIDPVHLS